MQYDKKLVRMHFNDTVTSFLLHSQAILMYAFWLFCVPVVLQATHWHQYSSRPKIFSTCCLVMSIVTCMTGSAAKQTQESSSEWWMPGWAELSVHSFDGICRMKRPQVYIFFFQGRKTNGLKWIPDCILYLELNWRSNLTKLGRGNKQRAIIIYTHSAC